LLVVVVVAVTQLLAVVVVLEVIYIAHQNFYHQEHLL
jgi:hypothetical protein